MIDSASRAGTLAERKRQLVRDELTEAALTLLSGQGFDETTIDQIVAAAGVSRRTFFRYFQSKEDVVVEFIGGLGRRLRGILAARPEHEPPVQAMRAALTRFADNYGEPADKSLRLTTVTLGTPALLARYLERQAEWRAGLADELAGRMGVDPGRDLRPALVAAVAFAAFDTALQAWVARRGARQLTDLVDEAFELLAALPR